MSPTTAILAAVAALAATDHASPREVALTLASVTAWDAETWASVARRLASGETARAIAVTELNSVIA